MRTHRAGPHLENSHAVQPDARRQPVPRASIPAEAHIKHSAMPTNTAPRVSSIASLNDGMTAGGAVSAGVAMPEEKGRFDKSEKERRR
jgi:hypothetical protein